MRPGESPRRCPQSRRRLGINEMMQYVEDDWPDCRARPPLRCRKTLSLQDNTHCTYRFTAYGVTHSTENVLAKKATSPRQYSSSTSSTRTSWFVWVLHFLFVWGNAVSRTATLSGSLAQNLLQRLSSILPLGCTGSISLSTARRDAWGGDLGVLVDLLASAAVGCCVALAAREVSASAYSTGVGRRQRPLSARFRRRAPW